MEKHSRTIFISSTVLPTPLRLFMKQCKQCSSKNYHVCQESLSLVLLRDIIYFSCNSFLSCFHIPLLQLETLLFHLISLVALLCVCEQFVHVFITVNLDHFQYGVVPVVPLFCLFLSGKKNLSMEYYTSEQSNIECLLLVPCLLLTMENVIDWKFFLTFTIDSLSI